MKPNKINLDSTGLDNKQLRTLAKNLNLDNTGSIPEVKARIDHYLKHLPEDVKKFLEEFDQMKEKDVSGTTLKKDNGIAKLLTNSPLMKEFE